MLNSSIVISPLVLFSGKVNKAVRRTYHIFLPIQVPPRTGSLCDFTENSLHRPAGTKNVQSSRDTRQNAGLLRSRIHGSTASENCLFVLKRRTHHTKLCFIWPQASLLFEKSVLFRDMLLFSDEKRFWHGYVTFFL